MSKFKITVGSFPYKANLVADIFYENMQMAEISNENNEMTIQIYCYKNIDYWEFSLAEFQEIIKKAEEKLLDVG